MYTEEEKAIKFVIKAFENQKRLKENINVAYHSIMVGYMLKDLGCNNTIVISGFLHDIIEDTDYNYDDLKDTFNSQIADIVLKLSEDQSIINYRERKSKFMEQIKNLDNEVLLIELADKLQNLISDYELWQKYGNDILGNDDSNYDDVKWYYTEFKKIFNDRLVKNKLLDRFNQIYELYFQNQE